MKVTTSITFEVVDRELLDREYRKIEGRAYEEPETEAAANIVTDFLLNLDVYALAHGTTVGWSDIGLERLTEPGDTGPEATFWTTVCAEIRVPAAKALTAHLQRIQKRQVRLWSDRYGPTVQMKLPDVARTRGQWSLVTPMRGRTPLIVDCGSYLNAVITLCETLRPLSPGEIRKHETRIVEDGPAVLLRERTQC